MKRLSLVLLSLLGAFLFSGCSNILMPYKSEFKCQKGAGFGVCNSVSENYKVISSGELHDKDSTETIVKKEQKTEANVSINGECFKCIDLSQAIWVKQRKLEKKLEEGQK
jgi:hypothetical protein